MASHWARIGMELFRITGKTKYKSVFDNGPKPGNTIDSIHGRLNEWLVLGRHDLQLQKRIEADYTGNHLKYFGTQSLGIAALNAKILIDGKPAY